MLFQIKIKSLWLEICLSTLKLSAKLNGICFDKFVKWKNPGFCGWCLAHTIWYRIISMQLAWVNFYSLV